MLGFRPPFFVFALPRSRTAWLSKFLSYPPLTCGHDLAVTHHSLHAWEVALEGEYDGTVETGAVLGWKALRNLFPASKMATIRRPMDEVMDSFAGLNFRPDIEDLHIKDKMLGDVPGISLEFAQLDTEKGCREIFEYCLEMPFDRQWWLDLKDRNIQINFKERIKELDRNREGIKRLKTEASAWA